MSGHTVWLSHWSPGQNSCSSCNKGPSPPPGPRLLRGFLTADDYRLREDSPAVDFSDSVAAVRDLAGNLRGVDLPAVFDNFGPTDLGAYERQPLPIVTSP